jgi:hypothetical protein
MYTYESCYLIRPCRDGCIYVQVHMHLETHRRRVHALHGCDVRVRVRVRACARVCACVRVRACVCCSSTPANTSRDREVDIPLGTSMVRSISYLSMPQRRIHTHASMCCVWVCISVCFRVHVCFGARAHGCAHVYPCRASEHFLLAWTLCGSARRRSTGRRRSTRTLARGTPRR